MKLSFRRKVILTFLAGILGCMVFLSLSCELLVRPLFINDSKKNMKDYGEQVWQALDRRDKDINQMLDTIETAYIINTTVMSAEGEVVYSKSGENVSQSFAERVRKWIAEYEADEERKDPYFIERYDDNYQIRRLIYIREYRDSGYIVMNKSIKGIEQDAQLVSVFIFILGLSISVIGTISWSFLLRPFTGNMKKMSRITRNMSKLNFEEKINYKSSDEIGVLADSIDELSEELKNSIETLQDDLERRKILIRNISHELKTPITTIKGYAENTQIVTEGNEKVKRYCDIMIEECDAIDRMVNEMLEMSKLESEGYICEKDTVNAEQIFEGVRHRIIRELPQAMVVIDSERADILGNRALLERAVFNFVENAVKYGEAGKTILLEGYREGDNYLFAVTNEGGGISEEEKEMIWDVFYKTDKSRRRNKGYGIGLSIVRQIAKLHGGGVDVSCKNGKTKFSLWVPYETVFLNK